MIEEFVNLRKSLGWDAADVAHQLGVSLGTIQSVESGRREMRRCYLLAMRRLAEHPEDRREERTKPPTAKITNIQDS